MALYFIVSLHEDGKPVVERLSTTAVSKLLARKEPEESRGKKKTRQQQLADIAERLAGNEHIVTVFEHPEGIDRKIHEVLWALINVHMDEDNPDYTIGDALCEMLTIAFREGMHYEAHRPKKR